MGTVNNSLIKDLIIFKWSVNNASISAALHSGSWGRGCPPLFEGFFMGTFTHLPSRNTVFFQCMFAGQRESGGYMELDLFLMQLPVIKAGLRYLKPSGQLGVILYCGKVSDDKN